MVIGGGSRTFLPAEIGAVDDAYWLLLSAVPSTSQLNNVTTTSSMPSTLSTVTNSPNNTLNPYPYPAGHHKTDPPFPLDDDVPYPPLPFICCDQFEPDLVDPLVLPDDANSASRASGHTRPSLYRVHFQGRDCVLKIVRAFPTLPCPQHA
jgi:hypothetical protein